ncbi:MAG: hypothetical protein K940chlam3_00044 [Chlamydiae bacterium]|nr:hypothetical protein [Chlamydiota bacterium]
MNELNALITLNSMPLLGSVKIQLLLQVFGSAVDALNASPEDLRKLPGFGSKIISQWNPEEATQTAELDQNLAHRFDAQIIPFTDKRYPKRLLNIPDFPILLYVKGDMTPSDHQSIAIIGTRSATHYGLEMAHKFGLELAHQGFTIISGLARGIDTAAHEGARKKGRTIAVLGSGLCNIYPSENKNLASVIAENGAVISEFPMNTPPDRQRFPQRNRIVSGMSSGILLIEAPVKSGAMITMRMGLAQGRNLYALSGRADIPNFEGNHTLIKSQQAKFVSKPEDIKEDFKGWLPTIKKNLEIKPAPPKLEREEEELLKIFPQDEIGIDHLASLANLPIQKLNVLIMSLILKKQVKEYPGRIYKKAHVAH